MCAHHSRVNFNLNESRLPDSRQADITPWSSLTDKYSMTPHQDYQMEDKIVVLITYPNPNFNLSLVMDNTITERAPEVQSMNNVLFILLSRNSVPVSNITRKRMNGFALIFKQSSNMGHETIWNIFRMLWLTP